MMKIKIHTEEMRATFYLPTSLVLSRLGLSIGLYVGRNYVSVPDEKKAGLLLQLRTLRRRHRGLCLVDIHTSEGEEIVVTL
ncbi:hypothetical protein [Zongyangia hominis]|uniref:Uncharacterized protein n=1 Tax=Zongyangia hominis TaxID=2763677 RepID=A0A926IC30_9FIRM|nr:hypothetical protein [Zongyangia hominis]MBC8570690.1 hypothetical protein [Zongyangia hominis]